MLGKRAVRPAEDSSGGGSHSAAAFTLVFADCGTVDPAFEGDLVHDPRLPAFYRVASNQLDETQLPGTSYLR